MDVNYCGQQDKKKEEKQFNCSMMIASVWDVLIVSLELHVLCQLIMDSTTIYIFQISTNVLQMEDWVHALRYVPILQDHSPAVVRRDIIYPDMPAMV